MRLLQVKKAFKFIIIILLIIATIALGAHYIASHNIPVLKPKGLISMKERKLIITSSILMLIVVIPVLVLSVIFGWRYREGGKGRYTPEWEHNNILELCWWGIPVVIIIILAIITWKTSHDLNPFKPIENGKTPLVIQAIALDWKWLFIYPKEAIASVNYICIPVNRPIHFQITAQAPMNSFWIPQLGGQIYAMPAMQTTLYLLANEPGIYEGRSSNINGKGFAGMLFKTEAKTEEEFQSWVSSTKGSDKHLSWDSYTKLVEPSEYNSVEIFGKVEPHLFDKILLQYMPEGKER